jgi:hypothetical protein
LIVAGLEARCFRICGIKLFRLADVPTVAMSYRERMEYHMRQRTEASIVNLIACIAAFVFVALIAMFGHPAAPWDRAATATANAASEVQANSTLTAASASPAEYRVSK